MFHNMLSLSRLKDNKHTNCRQSKKLMSNVVKTICNSNFVILTGFINIRLILNHVGKKRILYWCEWKTRVTNPCDSGGRWDPRCVWNPSYLDLSLRLDNN